MEKRSPSQSSTLSLSRTRMGPPFTSPLDSFCSLSPRFVDPSRCLYLAFSPGVGWVLSRLAFLHSPYSEPKVPEPAQAREAFGGPAAPASWVPSVLCFVSFRFSTRFLSVRVHAPHYARIRVAESGEFREDPS